MTAKTTEKATRRGVTKKIAEQRKAIIALMQDSSVTSYDIATAMGFNKVKTNNMLRAMEEDGIIEQDGIADAHPSGRGRPPFMWKLVDASMWKRLHGAEEDEDAEGATSPDGVSGNETPDTTTSKEEPPVQAPSTSESATQEHERKGVEPPEPEIGKTASKAAKKDEKVPEQKETVGERTDSDSTPSVVNEVYTIIVFKDNTWARANGKNILKYREAIQENDATTIDVPKTCHDIGKYIQEHEDELVF